MIRAFVRAVAWGIVLAFAFYVVWAFTDVIL